LIHGLVVETDLDVGPLRWVADDAPADLSVVRVGDRPVPGDVPAGRPVSDLADPADGTRFLTVRRDDAGSVVARAHGICDFTIDPTASRVEAALDPTAAPGLASVIAGGTLLALVLELRGHLVLHASAVVDGPSAVAVVGASGMGKSTMASLCCAAGARLLADDVLRVEVAGGTALAHAGGAAVRLRPGAASLVERFETPTTRSADERILLVPPSSQGAVAPLRAIVVPARREGGELRVTHVGGADALVLLSRFPRLLGVRDAEMLRAGFDRLAALVAVVPLVVAELPAGPPFATDLGARLLDQLA
jgi:hypothetical protein